jgi:hypothetical protein
LRVGGIILHRQFSMCGTCRFGPPMSLPVVLTKTQPTNLYAPPRFANLILHSATTCSSSAPTLRIFCHQRNTRRPPKPSRSHLIVRCWQYIHNAFEPHLYPTMDRSSLCTHKRFDQDLEMVILLPVQRYLNITARA